MARVPNAGELTTAPARRCQLHDHRCIDCYDRSTDPTKRTPEDGAAPRRRHDQTPAAALGRRIRELRQTRGWSQERLAEHATLDRSYIAGIEVGVRNPSLKALDKLATALSVKLSELFD